MKKLLTSVIVIALVLTGALTIFAACGNSTDYEHTIVFYSSQGQALQKYTQQAIDIFQAKYPGWKVMHSTQGGYNDVKSKIVGDIGAKQQPDLAYCYPDHVATYLQSGIVVNINELINSTATVAGKTIDFDATANGGEGGWVGVDDTEYAVGYTETEIKDFVSGYFNEGYAYNYSDYERFGYDDNDLLTLPFVKSTELLYYNSSALKAAGIEAPAKTWDELWEHCAILKQKFPDCTPLGYDSEANWVITMCQQNGWGYTAANGDDNFLFHNQDVANWLTKLKEYKDKGYFTTEEINGEYTSNMFKLGVGGIGEKDGVANTANGVSTDVGGVVYCIGSSGGASYQKSDSGKWVTGITGIPGSVVGKDADGNDIINASCISQGPSLVMLTGGNKVKNVEEKKIMTFLFVKELLDVNFQATFSIQSGYNPCRESVFAIDEYVDHLKGTSSTAKAAKAATTLSDKFFVSPAFDGSSNARDQVGNALIYVVTGQKPAAKALKDAYINCAGQEPSNTLS